MSEDPTAIAADDFAAIRHVVDRIDDTVDRKDWDSCRALFADELQVDFTSLAGGEPGPLAADDLIGAWRSNLHAAKPSFHMRTNHRVEIDGGTATCVSKGARAEHHAPPHGRRPLGGLGLVHPHLATRFGRLALHGHDARGRPRARQRDGAYRGTRGLKAQRAPGSAKTSRLQVRSRRMRSTSRTYSSEASVRQRPENHAPRLPRRSPAR